MTQYIHERPHWKVMTISLSQKTMPPSLRIRKHQVKAALHLGGGVHLGSLRQEDQPGLHSEALFKTRGLGEGYKMLIFLERLLEN